MIYKLSYDAEQSPLISLDGVELLNKMPNLRPRFLAQPKRAGWIAPEATLYFSEHFKGDKSSAPDLSVWATGLLALSPAAYGQFKVRLEKSGEFLPFILNGETYHFLNTLYVIPECAMDLSAAVDKVEAGVHYGKTGAIFDDAYLAAAGIEVFKTPTDNLIASYCTDSFKKTCDELGFTGLRFEPA